MIHEHISMTRYIYILMLNNDKFYIGQSPDYEKRFLEHLKGKGAIWTKIHQPKSIIETIELPVCNSYEAKQIENDTTINYMKRYRWDNVRGGDLVAIDDFQILKQLLKYSKKKYKLDKSYILQLIEDIPTNRINELEYYYRWVKK